MGYSRWDAADWASYSSTHTAGKSRAEVFSGRNLHKDFDPRNIAMRESRDSEANPESNALIIAFDVTGSMGAIPDHFIRSGLKTLVDEVLNRKPISDPHTMMMGVGDAWCDRAPLQATQFETDIRIAEQLQNIYLEGGGGGNRFESYNLPWYFAATRTSIDCFEKRGKKGYLFTIGDEPPPPVLEPGHVSRFLGGELSRGLETREVLDMASRMYEVFHVVVEEGSYARHSPDQVRREWTDLMGQRVLFLSDFHRLAEVITSAIEVCEGKTAEEVAGSWSGDTSLVVSRAVGGLSPTGKAGGAGGIVRL